MNILEIGGRYKKAGITTLDVNPDSGADIIADAHSIPLPDSSQDKVIADNMLEHLYDPFKFIEEVKRILKPKGQIEISAPFIHPYHGGLNKGTFCPDYWRFTEDGLRQLFKDFDVEITSDGGLIFALASFFPSLRRVLHFCDFLYPNGKSRHQYFVRGTKK